MAQRESSLPARWVRGVGRLPDGIWSPAAAALILLVPGLIGVASGLLLLPSLGPTALTQVHTPEHPSARLYKVLVSHLGALVVSCLVVLLFGLASTPSVFETRALSLARVLATLVAVVLALLLELVLKATHPPAISTTLLVTLGLVKPTPREILVTVLAILLAGAVGELLRQLRLAGLAKAGQDQAKQQPQPGHPSPGHRQRVPGAATGTRPASLLQLAQVSACRLPRQMNDIHVPPRRQQRLIQPHQPAVRLALSCACKLAAICEAAPRRAAQDRLRRKRDCIGANRAGSGAGAVATAPGDGCAWRRTATAEQCPAAPR